MKLKPNRVAVYLTAAASLLGGLAPVVADLDLESTAGIVAGLSLLGVTVNKWLSGWQDHEARSAYSAARARPGDQPNSYADSGS